MLKADGMPTGGPLIIPGPYHFEKLTMHTFFCRVQDPRNLKQFLPPGLAAWSPVFPPGTILLMIVNYPKAWPEGRPSDAINYRESCIFIPVFHIKTGPAFYCAFIYLDTWVGIIAGREVYGFPKKYADFSIKDLKTGGRASVTEDGIPIIQADWKVGRKLDFPQVAEEMVASLNPRPEIIGQVMKQGARLVDKYLPQALLKFRPSVINWKKIPAAPSTYKKPRWSVNELTVSRFVISNIYRQDKLLVGKNAVKLQGSPHSSLEKFTPLETLFGIRTKMDFTLPPGKVLRKYL